VLTSVKTWDDSSSEDEPPRTRRRVRKVMRMIRKINLMGVPQQVEDLLFYIDKKKQKREDASHAERRATSGTTV
jgi:septation ring formation regulator EzrA